MRMHSLRFTSPVSALLVLALTGCATTAPGPNDAAVEADKLTLELTAQTRLEERLLSDYELIAQVSAQLNQNNIYDESMQPRNKSQKCLLPFLVNNDQGTVALYWDGACHQGYATGLGRVVRTENGQVTTELLAELKPHEPHTLYTYLHYSVARAESEVGTSFLQLSSGKLRGHSATLGYSYEDWAAGHYDLSYRSEDTTNFVSATKVVDLLNGESSFILAYPNFSHDLLEAHANVLSPIERTYRLLEGATTVGLSFIWLKDGRILVRDNQTEQDQIISQSSPKLTELNAHIAQLKAQVTERTDAIDAEINAGLAQLERYHGQKCAAPQPLFDGDNVNHICDYLRTTHEAMAGLQSARAAREASLESYRQHQAKMLEELEEHLKTLRSAQLTAIH